MEAHSSPAESTIKSAKERFEKIGMFVKIGG